MGCERLLLRVIVIDEDRLAAGPFPRFYITPPVPNHEASAQFEAEFVSGAEEKSRIWFAAVAVVAFVMRASHHRFEPQHVPHLRVNRMHIPRVDAPE